MNRKVKLVLNIVTVLLFALSFIGFFLQFIYGWILGIGIVGNYKGYELALNFDGFPENLATLVPLLAALSFLIFSIVILIKKIVNFKKAPKEAKGGALKPLLISLFFVLLPLICFFLCLSTYDVLGLPKPKRYGGYYMGPGPYLVGYPMLVAGLITFINESGIFKEKVKVEEATAPKAEEKKVEKAPQVKADTQAEKVVTKPVDPTKK